MLQILLEKVGLVDSNFIENNRGELTETQSLQVLKTALFHNSLIKLSDELFRKLFLHQDIKTNNQEAILNLLKSQETAKIIGAKGKTNIFIAAMPKSGSSYLKTSLAKSLELKQTMLTTSHNKKSFCGLNGREQEIDELSLLKQIIINPDFGFVSQQHMKAAPYSYNLLTNFNTKIIVTFRNLFDGIVSYDDMIMKGNWANPMLQAPNKIPLNYKELPINSRLDIISRNYGVWCVDFYLSWRRLKNIGAKFLFLDYESYISKNTGDKNLMCKILADYLHLTESQKDNLINVITGDSGVSAEKSRFNKGLTGRGEEIIPKKIKDELRNYVMFFKDELDENDMKIILGNNS